MEASLTTSDRSDLKAYVSIQGHNDNSTDYNRELFASKMLDSLIQKRGVKGIEVQRKSMYNDYSANWVWLKI